MDAICHTDSNTGNYRSKEQSHDGMNENAPEEAEEGAGLDVSASEAVGSSEGQKMASGLYWTTVQALLPRG